MLVSSPIHPQHSTMAKGTGKLPAGSLSYASVALCYAIGDGETSTHGLLDCSVVAPSTARSSAAIVQKPPHKGLWNSLEGKLVRTGPNSPNVSGFYPKCDWSVHVWEAMLYWYSPHNYKIRR